MTDDRPLLKHRYPLPPLLILLRLANEADVKKLSQKQHIFNSGFHFPYTTTLRRNISFIFRSSRPEVFPKKGVLRNFIKFTGKHLFQNLFFYKPTGLMPATLLKKRGLRPATLLTKRLWHRRFPVNFAKFLRTPFLTEHLRQLLLNEERHDKDTKDTKYYIGNKSHRFPDLHLSLN